MFEKLKGISIKGGFFTSETEFNFFSLEKPTKEPSFISIVYGKNGSGKTALSQGFYEYAKGLNKYEKIELLDHKNNKIEFEESKKENIYVFNEDYIRENISFGEDEDGLKSVVMLGKHVETDKKIKELEKNKTELEKENSKTKGEVDKYNDKKNVLAPVYWENQIRDNLKKKWAVRERNIKDTKQNASVTDDNIREIGKNAKKEDLDLNKLKEDFESKLEKLKQFKKGEKIGEKVSKVNEDKDIDLILTSLLQKKIEKPKVSEMGELALKFIDEIQNEQELLNQSKILFSEENSTNCPFCLQEVEKNYKNKLIKAINSVLETNETMKHEKELKNIKIDQFAVNLEPYHALDEELRKNIEKQVNTYNEKIKEFVKQQGKKLKSLYSPIKCEPFNLLETQKAINLLLGELEKARESYNKEIEDVEKFKEGLSKVNKKYAGAETKEYYLKLEKQEGEKTSIKSVLEEQKDKLETLTGELNDLYADKKNINIAIKIINEYLAYIFFDNKRVQLVLENEKYIVRCRDTHVQLKNLSMGERNVIGLCYFFSSFFHEKGEGDLFKNACLVILDDPISSFDYDNKIGIYSFLQKIIGKIYSGNKNSRVLILTHEIEAMFNLHKICNYLFQEKNFKGVWELKDQKLIKVNVSKYYEYQRMLKQIYAYANKEASEEVCEKYSSESIGNIMRRALEAYGTFIYCKGIEALTTNEDILATIEDEKKRDFFRNFMFRLVLHGESHFQESIQGFPDIDFYACIDEAEKRETAKNLLVFLNLLNPLHLKAHFETSKNKSETINCKIKEWEKALFTTGK